MADPVVEGTAVDLPPGPAAAAPTTALVRAPNREVLMPLDAQQVVQGMEAYQQLMHSLLTPTDWQATGERNPDGSAKRFPKKSAWRKIARAFNLSLERVDSGVEYDQDGRTPIRAWATYRAIAPNGQTQDGDGYCALAEFVGKRRSDNKLENTMRATATTRAKNRAISDLVGMGEVSAEEMVAGGDPDAAAAPPFGPAASDAQVEQLRTALAYLIDPDREDPDNAAALAASAIDRITTDKEVGYMPRAVQRSLALVAATFKASREAHAADAAAVDGSGSAPSDEAPEPEPAPVAAASDRREEPPGIGDDDAPAPTFDPVSQTTTTTPQED